MAQQPGYTIPKDPHAVLPYEFDWSEWLDAAEIDDHEISISGSDATLVEDDSDVLAGNQIVRAILSGGTAGVTYRVTCHIVTNESPPREDDRSFFIKVRER
jgi:hypothetical protein